MDQLKEQKLKIMLVVGMVNNVDRYHSALKLQNRFFSFRLVVSYKVALKSH